MKKINSILILGASGFIGKIIYHYLKNRVNEFNLYGSCFRNKNVPNLIQINLLNKIKAESLICNLQPNYIIHLVGNKSVLGCQKDFSTAYDINVNTLRNVITSIKKNKLATKLIFFSSDYVFNGLSGYYQPNSKRFPRTNYGKTKKIAEDLLINSNIDYKIIRTSAVLGRGSNFYDWFMENANKVPSIKLYNNIYFTPTPINFLAESTYKIIINYQYIKNKVLHVVSKKRLTRYQLGLIFKKYIKCKAQLKSISISLKNSLFQKDLSIIQSDYIAKLQKKTFNQYLYKYLIENEKIS